MSDPLVGKPLDRVDGRLKVTGAATYSAEFPLPGVAYARIIGSTISRGRIRAIDTREASALPGVAVVLTHENAPQLPEASRKEDPNTRVVQVLQDDQVLYDGQPVALVVADSLEQAQHAASLVHVAYEATTPVVRIASAMDTAFVAPPSGPRAPADSSRGDFDQAFSGAPKRVDQTYTTPIENHNPMEMHATVASWQGDELTVYDATQWVFGVQHRLAKIFGVPARNVRVVAHYVGGAFGCKGTPWSHVVLAAMAARVAGRPVKLVLTRQQMFAFVGYRPTTEQHVSLGANADGRLVAIRHDVLSQTSRFDEFMEPAAYATRMLYACPNVCTSHRLVRLDLSTPTFMRAPGEASGSFALESAMDELSWATGIDPIELRLRNYAEKDEDEDKPFSSKSLRQCYRAAADRFGWSGRPMRTRAMRDGRLLKGWGMATATYPARQVPASALARIRDDGTALVVSGTCDIGTGTYTVMAQIAADELGLPFDRVRFGLGDTEMPKAPIEAGSMTASSVGSAVRMAARAARESVARLAGVDPSSTLDYAAILRRAGKPYVEVLHDEAEKEDRKHYSTHSFGAQLVEVLVDEDLGSARVTRAVGAFAAGRILNEKTARSQLLGGMTWGIGLALQEQTVRDARSGRVVTKELADYRVPVNADVPDLDVVMVPEEDPYVNEVGAKGIGEIGIVGMGAAIANAVYHATGKRVRDLPITVEKLL